MNPCIPLTTLSRRLLESKGYVIDKMDDAWPLTNDLIAVDAASNTIYVVFITTEKGAFSLWMELLGDERLKNLLSHTALPEIVCLIHKWRGTAEAKYLCETSELTAEDFEANDDQPNVRRLPLLNARPRRD